MKAEQDITGFIIISVDEYEALKRSDTFLKSLNDEGLKDYSDLVERALVRYNKQTEGDNHEQKEDRSHEEDRDT